MLVGWIGVMMLVNAPTIAKKHPLKVSGWRYYTTMYVGNDGSTYGSTICARSMAEATQYATQRNIGETIAGLRIGTPQVPTLITGDYGGTFIELLHWAVHLSWIESMMGVSMADRLSDTGVIHHLVHTIGGIGTLDYTLVRTTLWESLIKTHSVPKPPNRQYKMRKTTTHVKKTKNTPNKP